MNPAISSASRIFPFESTCLSKKTYYISAALGAIFLIGGIFCLLAAYKILPGTVNVMSELRGIVFGYVILSIGALGIVHGLWKSKDRSTVLVDNRPRPTSIAPPVSTSSASTVSTVTASDSTVSSFTCEEWEIQIQKAQVHDVITGPQSNSWKRGHPQERQQSFSHFDQSKGKKANAHRKSLSVIAMDNRFSADEDFMLKITHVYVGLVHGVKSQLFQDELLCSNDKRRNQYAVEWNLGVCTQYCPEDGFVLGFTSQDLYGGSLNFCFGVGVWQYACGLFSIFRLKGWTFATTLRRLMIVASHEFGHLRGMKHCVNFSCNMQGSNCIEEFDETPLTYCAECMAKICLLNDWSLKEGYECQKRVLTECQEACQTKSYSVDFSQEIATLDKKIAALSEPKKADH